MSCYGKYGILELLSKHVLTYLRTYIWGICVKDDTSRKTIDVKESLYLCVVDQLSPVYVCPFQKGGTGL